MRCNCSIANAILAAIIIVFSFWDTAVSQWIIVIAAVLLFVHSLVHKHGDSGSSSKRRR